MKSQTISLEVNFRAELKSPQIPEGKRTEVHSFSHELEQASKRTKRNDQAAKFEESKAIDRPSSNQNERNEVRTTSDHQDKKQNKLNQSDPIAEKKTDSTSEKKTNATSIPVVKSPIGLDIDDYFLRLSPWPAMTMEDSNLSHPEQSSTPSDLSTSAAQTFSILALMNFQIDPPLSNTGKNILDKPIGAYTTTTPPLEQLAPNSINLINNQDFDANAQLQTSQINTTPPNNILTSPPAATNATNSTTSFSDPADSSFTDFLNIGPFQSFNLPQTQIAPTHETQNISGNISMKNGDEFAQSTASFLIKTHPNGSHEATLKVSPEHLGPLRADIAMSELPDGTQSMTLTLTLSNDQAMDMAKDNLAKLQAELALAGISCPAIQLKMDNPISSASQTLPSEGSLHSSSNPNSGQPSYRDDSRSKSLPNDAQVTIGSFTENSQPINLFDRTV